MDNLPRELIFTNYKEKCWVKQNACNIKWIFQSNNVFELESYIAFDMKFF